MIVALGESAIGMELGVTGGGSIFIIGKGVYVAGTYASTDVGAG